MSDQRKTTSTIQLLVAACAAFATYFCMYAFRKPFTAGVYEGETYLGLDFKTVVVFSQLVGYVISKFIGVKLISETPRNRRVLVLLGLIAVAQLGLIAFAFVPPTFKPLAMLVNGLPLGMVFGLVLSYLEGRKCTEALNAALCASFIVSSGVVKSLGQTLTTVYGVSEYQMPMLIGFMFTIPIGISMFVLDRVPDPDADDVELRSTRSTMDRKQRRDFWWRYWPGLAAFLIVYVLLTVVRTLRDDFGVEIWQALGVEEKPKVFALSETWVAVITTAMAALTFMIRNNLAAIKITVGVLAVAFLLNIGLSLTATSQLLTPLQFMILTGVGLYVPYVAFHTTLFERVVASARMPGNLVFLMYLADSLGYLVYAVTLLIVNTQLNGEQVLTVFTANLLLSGVVSVGLMVLAVFYFQRQWHSEPATFTATPDLPEELQSQVP